MSDATSALPARLARAAEALRGRGAASGAVTLDDLGDAIGLVPVSADEVDALITWLEGHGLRVTGPEGARGVGHLQRVIPAARALAGRLGRTPTVDELAAEAGLAVGDVRHALLLARTMSR